MTTKRRRAMLLTAGLSVAVMTVAIGGGGGVGSNARRWCRAADDLYAIYAPAAQTNTLDSLSDAALAAMEDAGARMRDAGTPRSIRGAFEDSTHPERHTRSWPDAVRFYRADAAVFGWMLEHCDLSPGVRAYLREAHEELIATIAATPTTES